MKIKCDYRVGDYSNRRYRNNHHTVSVTHKTACKTYICYASGHGSDGDDYEGVCCNGDANACYRFKSTGEMGCFTMRNTTQNIGCKYECKNPADCQHRDQSTHADLPALAYAKKSGEGDICLCKGYYCNSIWFTGWEIFGIVIGAIAAAFLLCCLLPFACSFCKK